MLRSTLRRPSPALVVGIIALIAAMGGSAVAASKITSKQIKNNTIKGKDIKRGGVKPSDLSAKAKATLTGPKGDTGATGQQGPQGERGPSDVFHTGFNAETPIAAGEVEEVGRIVLPPGEYSLAAKLVVRHAAGDPGNIECRILQDIGTDNLVTEELDQVRRGLPVGAEFEVTLLATTDTPATENRSMPMIVECTPSDDGSLVGVLDFDLVATQVGNVTVAD